MMKLDHAITIIQGTFRVATACRHNIPRHHRPRQSSAKPKAKACREATLECSQTRQCLVAVECNTRPSGTADLPSPFPGQKTNYRCNPGPSPSQSKSVQPCIGVATACRHNVPPATRNHGPRLWQSPAAALRPAGRRKLNGDSRYEFVILLAGRLRDRRSDSVLSYFKLF